MKKILMIGAVAATMLTTACDTENEIKENYVVHSYNLVTCDEPDFEPVLSLGTYGAQYSKMGMDIDLVFTVKDLDLGTQTVNFTTPTLSGDSRVAGGGLVYFANAENAGSVKGMDVTDASFKLYQTMICPPEDLDDYPVTYPGNALIVANYKVGKYHVRTYWNDMTFIGNTETKVGENGEPADNGNIYYRVIMKYGNKATVIMYNVQFNPNMPTLAYIIIKDLDLSFSNAGWTISGQDIVPWMVLDNELTENANYKFDSFTMSATGDLTTANAEFVVAPAAMPIKFYGSFNGQYVRTVQ